MTNGFISHIVSDFGVRRVVNSQAFIIGPVERRVPDVLPFRVSVFVPMRGIFTDQARLAHARELDAGDIHLRAVHNHCMPTI